MMFKILFKAGPNKDWSIAYSFIGGETYSFN